jgi:hypothetical protein
VGAVCSCLRAGIIVSSIAVHSLVREDLSADGCVVALESEHAPKRVIGVFSFLTRVLCILTIILVVTAKRSSCRWCRSW